jgi:hypothetical protein
LSQRTFSNFEQVPADASDQGASERRNVVVAIAG